MLCPICKTDSARRSHKSGSREMLASLAGYRPYRCRECKLRFSSRRGPAPEASAPGQRGVEREISSTRSAMRWKKKRANIMLYGAALIVFGAILYFLTRPLSMGG